MFLAGPSVGQLAVDWNSCRTRLTLPTVEGAATYEFIRMCSHPCDLGSAYDCESLATTPAPEHEFMLAAGFTGRFRVIARDAEQQVLADLRSSTVSSQYAANGAPAIDGGVSYVRGFPGETVVVRTTQAPPDVEIRWLRDGVEMPGVTGAQFSIVLDVAMEGVQFVPVATSACGTTVGGARVIDVSDLPPSGLIQWRAIRSVQSGQSPTNSICGGGQCFPGPTMTSVSDYPATGGTFTPNSLSAGVGSAGVGLAGSGQMQIKFDVSSPVRGVFWGSNYPATFVCSPWVCGSASASLSGPVGASFATVAATWGPVELDLPPGSYSVTLSASGGTVCVYTTCSRCGHGGTSINATFTSLLPACLGDLNSDGVVSSTDLSEMFGAWGSTGTNPADLDLDGYVGNADLALLLGNWGACP
jgi:hypothetical protein